MIVRFSNRKVLCQIAYATIQGDKVVAAASSVELVGFGLPCGLTNYAAAYATGLLVARRLLAKIGMDGAIEGKTEGLGEEYHIDEDIDTKCFTCFLDIGLARASTGNRVFGAMKGACDGGLAIPHSTKRFPGYSKRSEGEDTYDPEIHRQRIFANHVASYMDLVREEDADKYAVQFSGYIKAGIDSQNLEETIRNVHAAIRANPASKPKDNSVTYKTVREGNYLVTTGSNGSVSKFFRLPKITLEERKARLQLKLAAIAEKTAAMIEEGGSDDQNLEEEEEE